MNSCNGNQPIRFDLHIHTTASDGTDSPEAVVRLAADMGFSVIAITDHDTIDGTDEAIRAGRRYGVRVIRGIEISAAADFDVHVLGFGIQNIGYMERAMASMRDEREKRMEQMVYRLQQLGIDIRMQEVSALSQGAVGRSHLARVLVSKGIVGDVREAFVRYLAPGRPGFVSRKKLTVEDAVSLITQCGGLAGIAHPGQSHQEYYWTKDRFLHYRQNGLRCIECHHMAHSQSVAAYFERIARSEGFLVTGGSDYHGQVKAVTLGDGERYWEHKNEDIIAFMNALGEDI